MRLMDGIRIMSIFTIASPVTRSGLIFHRLYWFQLQNLILSAQTKFKYSVLFILTDFDLESLNKCALLNPGLKINFGVGQIFMLRPWLWY